ncbi:response regulator, partial [bacterium]|nr:response regulator [bacterium]
MTGTADILVVDDQPDNLLILEEVLGSVYAVHCASGGQAALDHFTRGGRADLVLLDVVMPEMDGFEVCRRLKENQDLMDVPIIFISALNDSCDIVKAFNAGAADYITKPFRAEEVKARVTTHL